MNLIISDQYLYFLDSDDELRLEALEELYKNCTNVSWDYERDNIYSMKKSDIMISEKERGIIMDKKEFGALMKRRRKELGITQEAISEIADIIKSKIMPKIFLIFMVKRFWLIL